jgi:membrane protein DedA with SNARE-associated domain
METLFLHYIVRWPLLGYSLVFIGVIFEGDLFLLTTAFLTRLQFFGFMEIFPVVLIGTYTGDLLWFWLGRLGRKSDNRLIKRLVRLSAKVHIDFEQNFFRTLFITKFAYGTHHLTLVKAGIEGVPFRKYVENIFLASFLWIAIVGGLGYIFAASYLAVRRYFKYAEYVLLAALVIYFILFKKFSRKISAAEPVDK